MLFTGHMVWSNWGKFSLILNFWLYLVEQFLAHQDITTGLGGGNDQCLCCKLSLMIELVAAHLYIVYQEYIYLMSKKVLQILMSKNIPLYGLLHEL